MSGTNSSVSITMQEPIDYGKVWKSGQRKYNHKNGCEASITLVKQTCYIRDTRKTGIVIQNTNLMDTKSLKITCIILYLKKEILYWNVCLPTQCIPGNESNNNDNGGNR